MAEFSFHEVNGDPLNANWLQLGRPGTAQVVDDDGWLQPESEDGGVQFTIGGRDFYSSAYPDYAATGGNVEIFSARVWGGGQTVTFAYLTARNDAEDDRTDRIVLLEGGPLARGDWLHSIRLVSGDTNLPYAAIPSFICFTPGARITTPRGQVPVQDLRVGDLVLTADDGLQPVRWIGAKRMTGARLLAYPALRPIRIRRDALGPGLPDRDIWVSPQHRMLVSSDRTLLDYGEAEVLAPAKGLLNDRDITVDYGLRETTYIHILFDRHQIIWANGTPTESFHPGDHAIATIGDAARSELYRILPELRRSPQSYGPSARMALRVTETRALALRGALR